MTFHLMLSLQMYFRGWCQCVFSHYFSLSCVAPNDCTWGSAHSSTWPNLSSPPSVQAMTSGRGGLCLTGRQCGEMVRRPQLKCCPWERDVASGSEGGGRIARGPRPRGGGLLFSTFSKNRGGDIVYRSGVLWQDAVARPCYSLAWSC